MGELWDLQKDVEWAEDQLETAKDVLENAEQAIRSDKMAIRSRQSQLEQRERQLVKLKERVQYCKLDIEKRKRMLNRLNTQKSDLQITIELLQEDPGTEGKVKELQKKLDEVNRILTN